MGLDQSGLPLALRQDNHHNPILYDRQLSMVVHAVISVLGKEDSGFSLGYLKKATSKEQEQDLVTLIKRGSAFFASSPWIKPRGLNVPSKHSNKS